MTKKKELVTLDECIDWELENQEKDVENFDVMNALSELEEKSEFIFPNECPDCGWAIEKETKNKLVLHTIDEGATTKIHCFVYIYGYGTYVMKSAKSIQGEGYDDDLDYIYVTYEKRDDLCVKERVEAKFEKLAKQYKLYKE